jgi:hypothetical protein
MAAHQLPDVTIVADAGMISAANKAAGLSYILGMRIPDKPLRRRRVAKARTPTSRCPTA